ncbi:hypothetical protein SIID45300_02422 [Candidatus Magnetaquicoccaceae bacterium FCR-1]|uniref:Uncharacterized protein n=1 Tax=Candidatus Magnetaquiglobus chichijimensis TaxID=3141448 RepID=A0ABQ0CB10_9PROT
MNGKQLNLFAPGLAVEYAIKEAMQIAAKESGLSRAQIVDEMEKLAGRSGVKLNTGSAARLTEDMLDKWLNPQESERMIPLKSLVIFCRVVGSLAPYRVMLAPLEAEVISGEDVILLQWAKAQQRIKEERKRLRRLEMQISG